MKGVVRCGVWRGGRVGNSKKSTTQVQVTVNLGMGKVRGIGRGCLSRNMVQQGDSRVKRKKGGT